MGLVCPGVTHCSICGASLNDNEIGICKNCEIMRKEEIESKKEKNTQNLKEKIAETLENVGYTRGVLTYENDKNVYIIGEQMNNYLACITLAELIRTGALELNFKEEKNERKMKYLKKLLREG